MLPSATCTDLCTRLPGLDAKPETARAARHQRQQVCPGWRRFQRPGETPETCTAGLVPDRVGRAEIPLLTRGNPAGDHPDRVIHPQDHPPTLYVMNRFVLRGRAAAKPPPGPPRVTCSPRSTSPASPEGSGHGRRERGAGTQARHPVPREGGIPGSRLGEGRPAAGRSSDGAPNPRFPGHARPGHGARAASGWPDGGAGACGSSAQGSPARCIRSRRRCRLHRLTARSPKQLAPSRCAGSSRAGWSPRWPDGSHASRPRRRHARTPTSWIRSCEGCR